METSKRTVGEVGLTIHTVRTVIVGAGVAGLNAAEHLHELGHRDFVIVADSVGGASTDPAAAQADYYRMGMDWDRPDSPAAFADALCEGGMTHGDTAYVEAVNSIPEFLHLARNGVPFPRDQYGRYVGSGENGRVASAGPGTSALMAERSLERVRQNRSEILPRHRVIALLVAGEGARRAVVGALAIDVRKATNPADALVAFNCRNVILATGGPGALFSESLSPWNSITSHALALKAGAAASNLTETRFGLVFAKSHRPVGGVYQTVMPSYYSVGKGGREQQMFLASYFHATKQIASAVFFKGRHWPFSAALLQGMGPSIIDIAIHNELAAGRKVFVDFSRNIRGEDIGQFNISQLDPRAREFLESHNAVQFSPFDRLRHLAPEAIDALMDAKTDLREPQEVILCAEDTFGGLSVNLWWETTVPHLFAVGDVACTHGNPPDGAQLNAGQVGGLRAAQHIAEQYDAVPTPLDGFLAAVLPQLKAEVANVLRYKYGPIEAPSVRAVRTEIQRRMTAHGGMVRSVSGLTDALRDARRLYESIRTAGQQLSRPSEVVPAIENEHLCLAQIAFLEAMRSCIERGGGSRGAYLVLDEHGDAAVLTKRGSELRHRNENQGLRSQVLEVRLREGTEVDAALVPVRPLPADVAPKKLS